MTPRKGRGEREKNSRAEQGALGAREEPLTKKTMEQDRVISTRRRIARMKRV